MRTIVLLTCITLLAGCAGTAHRPLAGSYPQLSPQVAGSGAYAGTRVRWGGRVLRMEARPDSTCFEVASTPLNDVGRPLWTGPEPWGRFIACRRGYHDPAQFTAARDVSFVGTLDGVEERRLSGATFRLPRMAAEVIHLWPQPSPRPGRPAPWPWWGSWGD